MSASGDLPPPPPPSGPPVEGYPPQAYPQYPTYYPQPGYYMPPNPYGYPRDHPQAGLAFGLGLGGLIGGFMTCGLAFVLGPFAWYFGQRARTQVKQGNGAYHPEGNATAGMVLGIISTVLLVLAILLWIVMIVQIVNNPYDNGGTPALGLLTRRS